jgi:hypothetical protein
MKNIIGTHGAAIRHKYNTDKTLDNKLLDLRHDIAPGC